MNWNKVILSLENASIDEKAKAKIIQDTSALSKETDERVSRHMMRARIYSGFAQAFKEGLD